ncbi:tubulin-specific chaperone D-like isoform X1 [Amphiura filiformis]|uniref:tubulin-specific chaperone D-like isoform X1 n=1 Tax=Amphiura filiformis TaxID=82378 RepID=UPI003B2289C6
MLTRLLNIARNTANDPQLCHLAFKCHYLITKTRGPKIVVRLLPHEVSDLESTLSLLAQQNAKDYEHWETRYMLLLWLSIICMIPFDMSRLDSNVRSEVGEVREPIMLRIINASKTYLDVPDKSRDAASMLISKFLTRHDVKQQRLPEFLDWALKALGEINRESLAGMTALSGVLATLALLFKQGKREDIVQYAPVVLERIIACKLHEIENTQVHKLGIKLLQRLGLTFLKTRVASWRYQRGSRSLAENLEVAGSDGKDGKQESTDVQMEEEEEYDIPEEIEEIIDQLLAGLKDKDTIVRWSAAKGIGRVTGRLPQELADQVVESVLELFSLQESDGAWHGGCLALAELGRRGLLLPERLPEVVPVVLKALTYDEKRGSYSVGAHVRDAACYVCWAFARAYDPEVMRVHVKKIANALVIAMVFDREINCRKAASAAFQENVGRQGTFPHGIDIATTADYFAVGNRSHTYLTISVYISQFEDYTLSLIDHLYQVKISHWDSAIREVTSQALHNLTCKAPEYMTKTVLPSLVPLTTGIDLNTRHGALLAVAEITHALSILAAQNGQSIGDILDAKTLDGMKDITRKMDIGKMFKGISGNILRPAACKLIEKLSLSKVPFHGDDIIEHWQFILDENIIGLQRTEVDIQSYAIAALSALCNEYYRRSDGTAIPEIQAKLIDTYIKELRSVNIMAKMGAGLALGTLPKFMLMGKLSKIFKGLITATEVIKTEARFAEGRRDALKSLSSVSNTVGVETNGSPENVICKDNINMLYTALLAALKDYSLDQRGDVGAWVREAAMESLRDLTILVVQHDPSLLTPDICKRILQDLLQQATEKIDRTRACAGDAFLKLLHNDIPIPHIPEREKLLQIFPKSDLLMLNWSAPSDAFPKMTQLLSLPIYRYHVLLGLTVSVGGLTESLVKHSSQSLLAYLKEHCSEEQQLDIFTDALLKVFTDYQKEDRVSIPMMKMVDLLLSSGSLEIYVEHEKHPFPVSLHSHVRKEILRCGDPQKILTSIDVFCGLIQFGGDTRKKSLTQLLIFLCHKYPKVRKTTANKLYETLLVYDDVVEEEEKQDQVLGVLSETKWDEPVETVRPLRNQLCDMMDVPRPVPKTKANNTAGPGGQTS